MIQLLLKYRIAAAILFFVLLGVFLYTQATVTRIEDAGIITWLSLILLLLFWAIVIIDIFQSEIYRKGLWLFAMFILPYLTPVYYLFQRNRLQFLKESENKAAR